MGFEVLKAVTVKDILLLDVEPCSLVPTFRMNVLPPSSAQSLLLTIYLFGLPLDHENGGISFLRNIDKILPTYTAPHPVSQFSTYQVQPR
jgi:hypothetical protein